MSLITVCQSLALNVGLAVPDVVATSPKREWAEALRMANEAGEELARRVEWAALTKFTTLVGDGVAVTFDLPADFDRMSEGVTVRVGPSPVRPLSQAEWGLLDVTFGVPRYFKLEGNAISFWPAPSLASPNLLVIYLSKNWVDGATGYAADTDVALVDEELLTKGLIVRWRRQKGMPYADEEAEYEAALADRAKFDDRSRF